MYAVHPYDSEFFEGQALSLCRGKQSTRAETGCALKQPMVELKQEKKGRGNITRGNRNDIPREKKSKFVLRKENSMPQRKCFPSESATFCEGASWRKTTSCEQTT